MNTDDYRLTQTGAGFQIIKKSHARTNPTRHFHPYWEVMYIVSGKRTFFLENRTYNITEGTFVIIKPGVLHRALNPPDEVCCLYNVYFDDLSHAFYKNILPFLENCSCCITLPYSLHQKISMQFSQVGLELLQDEFGAKEMARSILMQIFVQIAREARFNHIIVPNDQMNHSISMVIDYLNLHYSENITLEKIANQFGVTESHLSRTFKKATHFNFVEYVNSLRITKSCKMLTETKDSVSYICEKCGFGSITQFGRCFKTLTGKSPIQYRKSNQKLR